MANHNLPTVTSNYVDVLSELDGRLDDIAKGLDPANTTATNVPTNSIRWSSASNKWEKWNGSAWADLSSAYVFTSITATGLNNTGNTTLGDSSADSVTINGTIGAGIVISGSASSDALRITQTGTGNALLVEDAANPDSSPFVIDLNGKTVIGNSAAVVTTESVSAQLQVHGTNDSGSQSINLWGSAVPQLQLNRAGAGGIGTYTALNSGNSIGKISFGAADGTAFVRAAEILAQVDGTTGTNDMPSRLVFSTTADGASTPTERMRISSTGETKFSYNAVIETTDNTNAALRITQTGTGNALLVEDSTNPDATPFVIDASGRVLNGSTTSYDLPYPSTGTQTEFFYQQHGTTAATITAGITSWNTSTQAGAALVLAHSKSGTVGTQTALINNDNIGYLSFAGNDGTNFIQAASIESEVDGTPSTNDMPARLVFSTTADGVSTPTERTRIDSTGRLRHFGTTILSNVDMLNASYDSVSFSVAGQETSPASLFFSPDGSRMFVLGATGDDVNEYSLSTPWVVSSASYVTNFSVSGQDTTPNAMFFRADGLKMYMLGTVNDTVYQYTLTKPWSISTASYDSVSFSVATEDTTPSGIFFKPNGLTMYIVGSQNDTVYQYTLSTAWDVSTATFTQSFSVSGQETQPADLFFTGDGTRMFVLGSSGDDVTVYNLTTPWDISTASTTGQFSISAQETSPTGIYVKPDGTKFYIVGSGNDTVYQYTIPSIDIQLTGTTAINGGATVAQDLTVDGNFSAGSLQIGRTSVTSPATTDGNVFSGTYTPTQVSTNTNVDAVTFSAGQYVRVGATVTVSGLIQINPTAASTATTVKFSLPIASAFANSFQLGGTASSSSAGYYGTNNAAMMADTVNDCVEMRLTPTHTTLEDYRYTFTYRII